MKLNLKTGGWMVAVLVPLVVSWLLIGGTDGGVKSKAPLISSSAAVPAAVSSNDAVAAPLVTRVISAPTTQPAKRLSMLEWQRALYDPRTTASAFAQAAEAAEAGDLIALREIHDLLVICRPVFQYVREGGERETWMANRVTPPNGIRWFEPHYDRCAAIATAPAFANWPIDSEKLTHIYWTQLAVGFNDPLFRSFEIAEYAGNKDTRAAISDSLGHLLRSGDMTAWWDIGGRLFSLGLTADKAVGLALIQVACARGYDCTRNNVHMLALQCPEPDCDAAATLPELLARRESAATNARAQALFEELTVLLDRKDWEGIERRVPLDGPVFEKEN